MKKIVFAITFLSSVAALACSYRVDEKAVTKELLAVAMINISGGADNYEFSNVETKSFKYVESKSTPMCPEELTFTAEFTLSYDKKGPNNYYSHCGGKMKVVKVAPFGGKQGADVYKVSGSDLFRCNR